jgi:hypothetical protein
VKELQAASCKLQAASKTLSHALRQAQDKLRREGAEVKIKLQVAGFNPEAIQGVFLGFVACLRDVKRQTAKKIFYLRTTAHSLYLRLRVRIF